MLPTDQAHQIFALEGPLDRPCAWFTEDRSQMAHQRTAEQYHVRLCLDRCSNPGLRYELLHIGLHRRKWADRRQCIHRCYIVCDVATAVEHITDIHCFAAAGMLDFHCVETDEGYKKHVTENLPQSKLFIVILLSSRVRTFLRQKYLYWYLFRFRHMSRSSGSKSFSKKTRSTSRFQRSNVKLFLRLNPVWTLK